jgi:hypothetical protein
MGVWFAGGKGAANGRPPHLAKRGRDMGHPSTFWGLGFEGLSFLKDWVFKDWVFED